jgi:hypothetical protein
MAEKNGKMLERLLAPVGRCLTPESAERLVKVRITPQLQARLDELADKSTADDLSPANRKEYEMYVTVLDVIGILQAKARALLAKAPRR